MAKNSNEEYLESLLGQVSKYTSDEDFLKEVDGDFPELEDEEFMEQFAQDIDNVFVEGYMDQTTPSISDLRTKNSESAQKPAPAPAPEPQPASEPESVADPEPVSEPEPAEEPAPTAALDEDLGLGDLLDMGFLDGEEAPEAPEVSDIPESLDIPDMPEEPIADMSDLDLDLSSLGLEEEAPVPEDLPEDLPADAPADVPDDMLADASDDAADLMADMGDIALDGDLDALGLDESEPAPEPATDDSGVSDELASLFDEVEEFSATDMSDDSQVENLVSSDDDLNDLADMLSSEDDGSGIDIFEGLEGLEDSFSMDSDASPDDLLSELGVGGGDEPAEEEVKEEKPKRGGILGFIMAILDSANNDDEPELTKEEKAALKEEKKKAAEEKKALKAEKKKAKADAKPKKEKKEKKPKKEKEDKPKEKGKPLPKLKTILIFLLAVSIIVLFIFGLKFFGYNINIGKARGAFNNGNYVEAYNQIKGMKVNETDENLQNQIVTMNKLYKHFYSFENLFSLKMYPEALNELLDGVKQYDKELSDAEEYGIKDQYTAVLDKISTKLMSNYGIGLKRAREIIAIKEPIDYSKAIYEITDELYKEK
ncbi:MAG: hypothetical protein E7241_01585 [Lachnospiraceae bacterium]|jgi:outer membrane biosynthesis protein TonB|nr:hypothetical protein [Lachnospiraceae bacterium]